MSADLLRKAATILRERAEAARPARGHWHVQQFLPEDREYEHQAQVMTDQKRPSYGFVASNVFIDDAAYIATMHPGVGLALADWLDDLAAGWVWDEHPDDVQTPDGWPLTLDESMDRHALALARLIVGEQP